jgi:hypothetical protein
MMSYLLFFAHYFTFYTLVASFLVVVLRPLLNPWAIAVVQGMAYIVFVSVLYIYVVYGFTAVQVFYQRFFSELFQDPIRVALIDISVHLLPILLVGFPNGSFIGVWGLMIAYGLFMVWFMSARQRPGGLSALYIPEKHKNDYDRLVFLYVPLVLILTVALLGYSAKTR